MTRAGLALTALFLTGSAAAAGQAVLITSSTLRAGPDVHYETLFGGAAGSRVETLDATLGWTLVKLSRGGTGWVENGNLGALGTFSAEKENANPVGLREVEVSRYTSVVWPSAGTLNLRAGPGTTYSVVQSMNRGDWVAVVAEAGPWVKVEHQSGTTGWAYRNYLTR